MLVTACVLGHANASAADAKLTVQRVAPPGTIAPAVIVGRAVCRGRAWLLTDRNRLVEVAEAGTTVADHALSGLAPADKVWGLACLDDGSMWTMASPRSLARIDDTGHLWERIAVQLPRIALFGAGARVVFQQLPSAPGVEVLASSPPRQPASVRTWAGLVGRRAKSRELQLTHNLAQCGLGAGAELPCWFGDELEMSVGDGRSSRTVALSSLSEKTTDRAAPIWDVAYGSPTDFWLLLNTGKPTGRRAASRIYWWSERPGPRPFVDLAPAARIVLSATSDRCLLVGVDGSLFEVVVNR